MWHTFGPVACHLNNYGTALVGIQIHLGTPRDEQWVFMMWTMMQCCAKSFHLLPAALLFLHVTCWLPCRSCRNDVGTKTLCDCNRLSIQKNFNDAVATSFFKMSKWYPVNIGGAAVVHANFDVRPQPCQVSFLFATETGSGGPSPRGGGSGAMQVGMHWE